MTLDTRTLIGAALFLLALLIAFDEPIAFARATGRALLWLLRKLCWLLAVLAWASVTLLGAIIAALVVIVTWLLESPHDRRMTLAARRRFS